MTLEEKIKYVDENGDLGDWEETFIADLYRIHIEQKRPLSAKQIDKLEDVYHKVTEAEKW